MKLIVLSICITVAMSGCSLFKPVWPSDTPQVQVRKAPTPTPVADATPATLTPAPAQIVLQKWLATYAEATSLEPTERRARLAALDAGHPQPKPELARQLALGQATLLATPDSTPKQWAQSQKLLQSLPEDIPLGEARYRTWLMQDISLRLQQLSTIQQLELQQKKLRQQISQLEKQIDALTNIEQSLTKRKSNQTEY